MKQTTFNRKKRENHNDLQLKREITECCEKVRVFEVIDKLPKTICFLSNRVKCEQSNKLYFKNTVI